MVPGGQIIEELDRPVESGASNKHLLALRTTKLGLMNYSRL